MLTRLLTTTLALMMSAIPLLAQSSDKTTYMPWGAVAGLANNVKLILSDEVDGNCWTNASTIQATTFLTFEQNDIFVPDYELAFINAWTPQARISAYGFRTDTGVCAVTASFSVEYGASDVKGGFDGSERFSFPISVSVFEGSAIFTNSVNVNDQLRDFFTGEVADYIGKVISVRRSE